MRKKCFIFLTLCALVATSVVAQGLSVSAQSALLMDAHSGRVLYAQNADQKRLIASTTKIMTAYVALQSANPDDKVTIQKAHTLVEGSRVYFKEGDVLTVRELLIGVLLQSGNDAALALADHCGGKEGIDGFVVRMNEMAAKLGMKNTQFANPHGLNDDGHYSTAKDMALLASAAMQLPEFAAISAKKTGGVGEITVRNHNKMLWNYDGANGVKTGYTQMAGRCLVSSAERNGQLLVAVTLDAPSDWDDHARMLDFGFTNFPERRLCTKDSFLVELPVVAGVEGMVDVHVRDTLTRALKEEEARFVRAEVTLPRFVWAAIEQGETVGKVRYWLGEELIGESELYANATVSEQAVTPFWQRIFGMMSELSDTSDAV